MIQTASYDNPDIVPPSIRDRYSFFEVRNACGVLAAVARDEWTDIIEVLDGFSFSANLLLQAGGNNSAMADRLNGELRDRGWAECKYVVRREGRIDYRNVCVDEVYCATRCPAKKRTPRQWELALPLDLTTTTVTSLDQAQPRVDRGEAGTCPVAVIAVSERTWDDTPYGPVGSSMD